MNMSLRQLFRESLGMPKISRCLLRLILMQDKHNWVHAIAYDALTNLPMFVWCFTMCTMGGSCCFRGTGCRSAAVTPPLASSGLVRCEAVLHSYGTNPLEGGGVDWLVTVWLYSATSLGHQANDSMTCYPTQLHYPDTERTSPCPILIMPGARLGSDQYQF